MIRGPRRARRPGAATAPPPGSGRPTRRRASTKHLHHPALGDVAFQHTVLQVADQPEQTLVYYTTDEVPPAKLAALAAEIG